MSGPFIVEKEVFQEALAAYGTKPQINMVMEKMAELQKELCKNLRGRDNVAQIAEEIADVSIMLDQMMLLFDCEDDAQRARIAKVVRLKERLKDVRGGAAV